MNIWTQERDYKIVSKKKWHKIFSSLMRDMEEAHDRYLNMGIKAAENNDYQTEDFCAERCSDYADSLDFNKNVLVKERAETGRIIYGLAHDGVPTLIPAKEHEIKEVYDEYGNVKRPKYLV